ncbi:hypothetical protein AB6813_14080 [bacterium RCC_150]
MTMVSHIRPIFGGYYGDPYNGNPAPNDHTYYTRTVQNSTPSAFLYLPGSK